MTPLYLVQFGEPFENVVLFSIRIRQLFYLPTHSKVNSLIKTMKRAKGSGHSFRVKKAKREEETAALKGTLDKFVVNIHPEPSSSSTENASETIELNQSQSSDIESEKQDGPPADNNDEMASDY